jgi:hypothetical protein
MRIKHATRVALIQRSALDESIEWRAPKVPPRVYTRVTPSAGKLLRHYLKIVNKTKSTGFRYTLDDLVAETGLAKITIRRGNDCLRQLGMLEWRRGYAFSQSNWAESSYVVNLPAIRTAGFIR